jgi:hypothetical protein
MAHGIGTSIEKKSKTVPLPNAATSRFLNAYNAAQQAFKDHGLPPLKGTPVGYLLDVPEVESAAKAIVDANWQALQKKPTLVDARGLEWTVHLSGDRVSVEMSWAERA